MREGLKRVGAVLLAIALLGCANSDKEAKSAATRDEYRTWKREHPGMRRSEWEAMKRADEREKEREAAEGARAAEQERRKQDENKAARIAAIRSAPKVPELGATVPEAKALCAQQHGRWVGGTAVGCKVGARVSEVGVVISGGETIFACSVTDEERVDHCDSYWEGADLTEMRDELAEKLGPPTSETVSAEGFRVFTWSIKSQVVSVTMYAKGVRKTVAAAARK